MPIRGRQEGRCGPLGLTDETQVFPLCGGTTENAQSQREEADNNCDGENAEEEAENTGAATEADRRHRGTIKHASA